MGWERSVGNSGISVTRDGISVWENEGGSVFTSTGDGCSLDEFLDGRLHGPVAEGQPCARCARVIRVAADLDPKALPPGFSPVALRPNPIGYTVAFRCSLCGTIFANREIEWGNVSNIATERLSPSLVDQWVIAP